LGLKIEKTRFVESPFLGLKMGTQQMENFPVVSALTALCLQGTWWEEDLKAGIWWWWTPQAGWGRWKSTNRTDEHHSVGGWMVKAAALVFQAKMGHEGCLRYSLLKLQDHHALQPLMQKMEREWLHKGVAMYAKYFD